MPTPNLNTITTTTPGILASAQMASGDNTVYAVASNRAAKLATVTLANTSASAVTVSVSLVKSGSAAGAANRVVSGYSLAAGDSIQVTELAGAWMGEGDSLVVNSGAASAVAATVTGLVFA